MTCHTDNGVQHSSWGLQCGGVASANPFCYKTQSKQCVVPPVGTAVLVLLALGFWGCCGWISQQQAPRSTYGPSLATKPTNRALGYNSRSCIAFICWSVIAPFLRGAPCTACTVKPDMLPFSQCLVSPNAHAHVGLNCTAGCLQHHFDRACPCHAQSGCPSLQSAD